MTVPSDLNQTQAVYAKTHMGEMAGSGMPPAPQAGMPQSASTQPAKNNNKKTVLALLALVLFFGVALTGVLISRKQQIDPTPAPSAPESRPSADVVKIKSCTLTFDVAGPTATPTKKLTPSPTPKKLVCGATGCKADADCTSGLVCVKPPVAPCPTAKPGQPPVNCLVADQPGTCSQPALVVACKAKPSVTTCCSVPSATPTPTKKATPTPTPKPLLCGAKGCKVDADCVKGNICVLASNNARFCSLPDAQTACKANPSVTSCCTQPTLPPGVTPTKTPVPTKTPTPTKVPTATPVPTNPTYPTDTPVPTNPPSYPTNTPAPTPVDTNVACNEACSVNSDCANISHICYNGYCRLDQNPEDEFCRMPDGTTVVMVYPTSEPVQQPELPPELPQSGSEGLANFLKVGLGALGLGVLLLLFL